MLLYEDSRTKMIVNRLVQTGNASRIFSMVSGAIILGVIFSGTAVLVESNIWWLGGIVGIVLGIFVGKFFAALITVILEWMAQVLIVQNEIVALLKNK